MRRNHYHSYRNRDWRFKGITYVILMLLILFFLLFGCETKEKQKARLPATLQIMIMDSPADFEELNLQIRKTEAYIEGKGWQVLDSIPQQYNLISLTNGNYAVIVRVSQAEPGYYSMIRLHFGEESNIVINQGGKTEQKPLKVASAKEVRANLNVYAGEQFSLLLDFQVAESVQQKLNEFYFDPEIRVVKDLNTAVSGQIGGPAKAVVQLFNSKERYSTYTDEDGRFLIRGVEAGVYNLKIINGDDPSLPDEYIIDDVVVFQGETTRLGLINTVV